MKKYKLKYWYLATGMEGIPQEYPEKIIEANNEDEALYKYHQSNGIYLNTKFEDFIKLPQHKKSWATSIKDVKGRSMILNEIDK